jgi:hypothetical protein
MFLFDSGSDLSWVATALRLYEDVGVEEVHQAITVSANRSNTLCLRTPRRAYESV